MLIHFCKIFNCKVLSNVVVNVYLNCREITLKIASCDRVANFQSGTFEKKTITVTEVVFIQVYFLTVGSKHKKIKMKARNAMTASYHSKFNAT